MLWIGCGSESTTTNPDGGTRDPDAASDLCGLRPGGSLWVVEGEEITIEISCETEIPLTDLTVTELPTGAVFDSSANTIIWTPALDQAAVYTLSLQSTSNRAADELQIGVADAFDNPANQPIVDKSKYTMELGLPVLFLANEPGSDDDFESMLVTYRGIEHNAEAKLRGKSSISYPKKSYALRFNTFDTFTENEFADFTNRRRVILTSTFDDNAYFRQRMAYNLWSQLDPSIAPTAYNIVVYRGNEYRGLYTISDHINADLMKRSGLSDSGNLYKAENHDANFRRTANDGDTKSKLSQGYSKTEGTPKQGQPNAFLDLEELVAFVADSDDETFNAEIANRIDIDDYVSWWLHVTFLVAGDSGGKNSYHYHDQARTWRVAPWDFNMSLGQSWETTRTDSDDYVTFFNRNEIFRRLANHPTIGPAIIARYKESLESGVFSAANLNAMIDGYMAEIGLSAARDWKRWQTEYYGFSRWSHRNDFTTHIEEVAYVRSWISERWQYVYDNY